MNDFSEFYIDPERTSDTFVVLFSRKIVFLKWEFGLRGRIFHLNIDWSIKSTKSIRFKGYGRLGLFEYLLTNSFKKQMNWAILVGLYWVKRVLLPPFFEGLARSKPFPCHHTRATNAVCSNKFWTPIFETPGIRAREDPERCPVNFPRIKIQRCWHWIRLF